MSEDYRLINGSIVNEGEIFEGEIFIKDGKIDRVFRGHGVDESRKMEVIDLAGKYVFPGVIDDQVHFREPGLTYKANIYTESKAAVAGGITSFMEMPNTVPNTLTRKLLEEKYEIGAGVSLANYSFYMGASNENIDELLKTDPRRVCGIKVFMGASTGNMLVDNPEALNNIFSKCDILIATHCEDEPTIQKNLQFYKAKYANGATAVIHPEIRSEEACYLSSSYAVNLAKQYNTRLHVLHLSTGKETNLFSNSIPLEEKRITAEVCVHHLWFSNDDYKRLGNRIKWNPAIKTPFDRDSLFDAMMDNRIDVIATDHAPHTIEEKDRAYFSAPSGGPLVQHSLPAMLEFYHNGRISLEKIVEKMCHHPATCFQVEKRGFIREGYWADLAIIDINDRWTVDASNILYRCKWSPFEGYDFRSKVYATFVNGHRAFANGLFDERIKGRRLTFNR